MKQLLMMRGRSLSGPLMTKHFRVPRLSKSGFLTHAFPELSDAVLFEANIEDGVPGTIIAIYNDNLELSTPFNIKAFTVLINGVKATITGVSVDPVDLDNLLIEFTPRAYKADFVTFQYDARIDPGFIDTTENKPINYAVNGVTNLVQEPQPANDFSSAFDGAFT